MIKAAIDRILELGKVEILNIHGDDYSTKPINRIDNEQRANAIDMFTLSGLIEYIKNTHDKKPNNSYIVHIKSPTEVQLISELDRDRKREVLAIVHAETPEFRFNHEIEREQFTIGVQSKFVDGQDDDKALILKFAGTVKNGSVTEYSDDGVSQKATVKNGVSTMTEAIVPSPCTLTPYRTFTEVTQPKSQFIFRLNEGRDNVIYCALYEADGNAWRVDAKRNIKEYLDAQLKGVPNLMIIS